MPADDRTLLIKTRKGHEPSARALWERFAPRLCAYATARTGSRELADEAVQSAFCTVLERPLKELRTVDNVEAWLVRMVRNAAINTVRAESRRRDREHTHTRPPTDQTRPDADLGRALAELDDDHAEVVMLKHAAGLTFDQIAFALDCNRSTAASRYRAAIDRLRAALDPEPMGTHR